MAFARKALERRRSRYAARLSTEVAKISRSMKQVTEDDAHTTERWHDESWPKVRGASRLGIASRRTRSGRWVAGPTKNCQAKQSRSLLKPRQLEEDNRKTCGGKDRNRQREKRGPGSAPYFTSTFMRGRGEVEVKCQCQCQPMPVRRCGNKVPLLGHPAFFFGLLVGPERPAQVSCR